MVISIPVHPLAALEAPGSILFDTTYPVPTPGRCYAEPVAVLRADTLGEVAAIVEAAAAARRDGLHVAGVLTYEAGAAFVGVPEAAEHIREAQERGPLVWLGCYEHADFIAPDALNTALRDRAQRVAPVTSPRLALSRVDYAARIAAVRDLIYEGEVYQINYTFPLHFGYDGDALALYAALRARQPVGYGAVLHLPHQHLLSLSPELFFEQRDRIITARPMKGTAPRGANAAADAAIQRELHADPKSRAENLMIVDLLRNDLAQVCEPGSVAVPDLFTVEPYTTLMQMTSSVVGALAETAGFAEIVAALFPCGSVTGAPKRRAMRHIAALETGPRGPYCGAVGYAEPEGRAVFNVAIRTITLDPCAHTGATACAGTMGIGSGIVWDSDADAEFDECRLKARFLTALMTPPVLPAGTHLIETMRCEAGVIALLPRHLARLERSSEALAFTFDAEAVGAEIAAAIRPLSGGPHRVRLLLSATGDCAITTTPLAPEPPGPVRIGIAPERADAGDWRLHHKTTARGPYERAYAHANAKGWDEALLLNTAGEVTEGSRSNVYIRRGDRFMTPPLACGLLGGVYREHLLATRPDLCEVSLTPYDLHACDVLYVSNAVWGLREAVLVDDPPAVNLE